jgi:hypothetical protein
VYEGGEAGAIALYEARGDVAKAQAHLSEARPQRAGAGGTSAGAPSALGAVASLVDEAAGLTPEVLQAKLLRTELESTGPRLSADVGQLKQQRPSLEAPPPGVPKGFELWSEYVTYWERRLSELELGQAGKGPLRWEAYERMRGLFARGLAFERTMVALLRADAELPRAQRRWLKDFHQPRIETNVGVLVIEERPPSGQPPRVESFSFKSRDLSSLGKDDLTGRMKTDARDALEYYGGSLDLRRPSLTHLGPRVRVRRVRLIYEGGTLKPTQARLSGDAMKKIETDIPGVEVLFQ